MSDVCDRVLSSTPLNKTAGVVTGKGVHWEPNCKVAQGHWKAPPPMRTIPEGLLNLAGVKFGRFTVVGMQDVPPRKNGKGAQWVVRCVCGDYEVRTAKAIRNPANSEDKCVFCRHLANIKKHEKWLLTAKGKQFRPEPLMKDDAIASRREGEG